MLFPAAKKARFVRVTADKLWRRSGDYCFALAELHVESGGRNVALGKAVTALDAIEGGRWSKRHLVDNFDSRRQRSDFSRCENGGPAAGTHMAMRRAPKRGESLSSVTACRGGGRHPAKKCQWLLNADFHGA